ncbi:hypothetical protein CBER1_09854 [Cercospora berteroae]|uniref:Glycosyl transferase CAP10 domain-containing protein n=1 Tax=Cercospora berteroae TaxID=357750 RepID=A0A2S6CDY6_9PEZI|nr:hypothetical protein CBER1_09854 [Cercospora berteroae]
MLVVYIAFLPKDGPVPRQLPPLVEKHDRIATDLCWRAVVLLAAAKGIQVLMFGLGRIYCIQALLVGVAKALSWFFLLRTRRHIPWCIAPATRTFSVIAACDPFKLSSGTSALFNVVASALALAQVIYVLPERTKYKPCLWVLLLASLAPYLANLSAIRTSHVATQHAFSGSLEHPVDRLINNAKSTFEDLVQRQSKSYTSAHEEYQRRYGMEPPDGFEEWYNFATAHQSPIIDDFDTIYNSVSPFWRLSGTEVLQIMEEVQSTAGSDVWSCTVSSAGSKTHCQHPFRKFDRNIQYSFEKLLGDSSVKIPDVKFLVNHLDEPRALVPSQSPKASNHEHARFTLKDLSHQPTWDAITKSCASSHRHSSRAPTQPAKESLALPFVTNISSAMDLCLHPEYRTSHGLFTRPTSFRPFEGLIPIFSTGSPSTMGDILYPSPAYLEPEFQYDEAHDAKWEKKTNNLYWVGSTTGGYASDDQWRNLHRQRFVALAQNIEHKQHTYLRDVGGMVTGVASKFLNARLFDVAFTRVFQCPWKFCREQKAYFRTKPWADKYKAFRSRLTFDMDGNGISGRYYQLLASKSVVLKQTLLREWHDDRLVPWAHYVPVSQGLEELPELVSYLTTSERGQRKAKEIADLGREWHSKAFREVDLSIYVYRLLLEMARLQDPKRQAVHISK